MEVTVGNNSFIHNSYDSQTVQSSYSKYRLKDVQSNYLKNQPSALPLNNNGEQISETYKNLCALIDVLENKIYDLQIISNPARLNDKYVRDLKKLLNNLILLGDNLNTDNLEQTLADLKSLGEDNYELLQQLLKMENTYTNKKSASVRSYMFSLYDRANVKKSQSLGIDVYY